MADNEGGFKWWLRYVIVPVIGGGGIVAIWVSIREHPSIPSPQGAVSPALTTRPQPGVEHKPNRFDESVQFYASNALVPHEEHNLTAKRGETILLHWDVQNYVGSVFLKSQSVAGTEEWMQVASTSSKSVVASETMDYYLELRGQGPDKQLGVIRVSVIP